MSRRNPAREAADYVCRTAAEMLPVAHRHGLKQLTYLLEILVAQAIQDGAREPEDRRRQRLALRRNAGTPRHT